MLRIVVVDDSAVARRLLTRILESDPDIRVVGEAEDGERAVALADRLRPDVMTMDIHMPVMDGLEAIRTIMERRPVPIVVATSSADPRDTDLAFHAVQAGALALVEKPKGPGNEEYAAQANVLISTVKEMAGIKLVTRRPRTPDLQPERLVERPRSSRADVAAIGASTGGPSALATILGSLPSNLPIPILVVQHISEGFDLGFARWLDSVTPLRVSLAEHLKPLRPGEVIVAPNGRHLGVTRDLKAFLDESGPLEGHRPSASYLFQSVARSCGARGLGVILTGMGSDGSPGLLELKRSGGLVIAQDQATSVVYGMPARSIEAGAVDRVVPLDEIAGEIIEACRRNS